MVEASTPAQQGTRLSSRLTNFYKYAFPAVWIVGFGSGALELLLSGPEAMRDASGRPTPELRIIFPVMWVLGTSFLLWFATRLKHVYLVEESLLVPVRGGERRVPLRDISKISLSRWMNPPTITVRFRTSENAAQKLVFLPRGPRPLWKSLLFWKPHPVAEELRWAVEQAKRES